ncbi:hypothetical protein BGZ65_008006, partial [Modicella reniformis]
ATSDSDFLFHGIDVLLRQDPRRRSKYRAIHVQPDILDKLNITADAWTVAGAVTKNDYTKNVPGCSLHTNVDIMKAVDVNLSREDILLEYCERVSVERDLPEVCQSSQFDQSRDIFFDHRETRVGLPLSTNTDLDMDIKGVLEDLQVFLLQSADVRKEKRVPTTAPALTSVPASSSLSSTTTPVATSSGQAPSASLQPSSRGPGRKYLKLVPGNKFRAKEFLKKEQIVAPQSEHSRTLQRNTGPRTKKKKRKTLYDSSSRKKRQKPSKDGDAKKSGRTNIQKPATIIQTSLNRYATITMNCGTLSTQLKNGLEANNVGDRRERDRLRKEILDVINEMVRIGTEVTRCAEQAISLYIAKVTAEFPSLDERDIISRKERLQFLGCWDSTSSFFGNLLHDFFSWHNEKKSERAGSPSNACIQEIVKVYRDFLKQSGVDVPNLTSKIETGLGPFLQLAGTRLADTLQIHLSRNVSELVERLKDHNPSWAYGEGQRVLAGIDSDGKSTEHDAISLFWILNSHLPASQQMAFVPEGGFGDKFFTITEYALVTALLREGNAEVKDLLGEGFGTQAEARRRTNEHPGDLFYRLFFSKNLSYTRGLRLTNPDSNISQNVALMSLSGDTQEEYDELVRGMNEAGRSESYPEAKEAFKTF